MIAVDTNILVYAHRQELMPHRAARKWLKRTAEGREPWGIPVFCLGEFVRVVTHPRLFDPPFLAREACEALDRVLESPSVSVLTPGPGYPGFLRVAVEEADACGNLVFDAQIVALCREHGVSRLVTADRDFARFSGMVTDGPRNWK